MPTFSANDGYVILDISQGRPSVRTTLNIDDDVLSSARKIAAKDGKTTDQVISALARKALHAASVRRNMRNGIPLLTVRPGVQRVTAQLVRQLQNDLQ
jgi:hypothetical protein